MLKFCLPSTPPNEKRLSWSDALAATCIPGDGASPVICLCSHNSEYGSKISTTEIKCCLLFSEKSFVRPPCTTTLLPTRHEMCKYLGNGSYLREDPVKRERSEAMSEQKRGRSGDNRALRCALKRLRNKPMLYSYAYV